MLGDIKNYFADFDGTTDACRTIALWISLALVVAYFATRLYVYAHCGSGKRRDVETLADAVESLNGRWTVAALVTSLCFIVAFVACYFVDVAKQEEELVPILFYPLLATALIAVGGGALVFAKPEKKYKVVCITALVAAFFVDFVCIAVHYASGEAGAAHNDIGLCTSALALVAAIAATAIALDRNSVQIDTRSITHAAVCVALGTALSYVRIFKMPMGGSITLASMLPLMLFAFMFGCRKGLLAGAIYGALQAIQDPWIIHPAQFALDYLAAFAAIGLTGCVRNSGILKNRRRAQFVLGAAIACSARFLCHYFSGVFAFGMYGEYFAAEYNMPLLANPYLYSLVYQCMYLVPELIIVTIAGAMVLSSTSFKKQIEQRIAANTAAISTSESIPIA